MARISTLDLLRADEIPQIGDLARTIWREHYASIISAAQIEYMLQKKYTPADLQPYIGATGRWFDVLRVDGAVSGFLRTARSNRDDFKLEEIYLLRSERGRGYGKMLLERAESRAREHACRTLFLWVNRANELAIAAYLKSGYAVRESQKIDIGQGFFMDDYMMTKSLFYQQPVGPGRS